jgi:hypothetical protein
MKMACVGENAITIVLTKLVMAPRTCSVHRVVTRNCAWEAASK